MRSSDTGDGPWPGSRLDGAACANAVVGDNTAIASTTAAKRFMSVLDASSRRTSSEKEADTQPSHVGRPFNRLMQGEPSTVLCRADLQVRQKRQRVACVVRN